MLSKSFFEQELPGMREAFGAEQGTDEVAVEVLLGEGIILRAQGAITCTESYLIFDHTVHGQARRAIVPLDKIAGIGLAAEKSERGRVGFKR